MSYTLYKTVHNNTIVETASLQSKYKVTYDKHSPDLRKERSLVRLGVALSPLKYKSKSFITIIHNRNFYFIRTTIFTLRVAVLRAQGLGSSAVEA